MKNPQQPITKSILILSIISLVTFMTGITHILTTVSWVLYVISAIAVFVLGIVQLATKKDAESHGLLIANGVCSILTITPATFIISAILLNRWNENEPKTE